MKLTIFLAIFYIFIIGNSSIICTVMEIKYQKTKNHKANRVSSTSKAKRSIANMDWPQFLISFAENSGIPTFSTIVTAFKAIWDYADSAASTYTYSDQGSAGI